MSGDVRHVVLLARRLSIAGVLVLGYLYFRLSGGGAALAAIGLISFAGVAQVLPALLGGIFWRGATRPGALGGLSVGFALWVYTLFLPSFGAGVRAAAARCWRAGPSGIGWLRPQALFGIDGHGPAGARGALVDGAQHRRLLSPSRCSAFRRPLERLQGAQFVNVFEHSARPARLGRRASRRPRIC